MLLIDAKEKHYMKEIARLISSKTSEVLGGSGKKSVDLPEIKKWVDGAAHDEPRVVRALDHMVAHGALEKTGFRWETADGFSHFIRELYD